MTRILTILWLGVVLVAFVYLGWRVHEGLTFRTDLMALLPQEEQNPTLQKANDVVTRALSQKLVVLVGHEDRAQARAAAVELSRRLQNSGLVQLSTSNFDQSHLRSMGMLYFPYRRGLLSDGDRQRLLGHKPDDIAIRALSQVYGFVGMGDAAQLKSDPFLLMQSFVTGLPLPYSRLALDDSMLSLKSGKVTWVMVGGQLTGDPYSLDVQKRLSAVLDLDGLSAARPGLQVLRVGAVFFAQAGADQALSDTSTIGLFSVLGTIILLIAAYRAVTPLALSLLVIGVGVGTALSASLFIFGKLHVVSLLFGVSLIGVAVDYSLQYCTEIFAASATPQKRLRKVIVGVSIGTATTVIGYLTLLLTSFPGLHQIAFFSVVGLISAWLTVVLWLPRLDRGGMAHHGAAMLKWAAGFLAVWEGRKFFRLRLMLLVAAALVVVIGLSRIHVDDDVRHLQSLSPPLIAEQDRIQSLIGSNSGNQFFLVQGADDETALQREEALVTRLRPLVTSGALLDFQAPAQFVPSRKRQLENRELVSAQLDPLRAEQGRKLGLSQLAATDIGSAATMTLAEAVRAGGPLSFLSVLVLEPGLHVVNLDGVHQTAAVAAAANGLEGVRFIDPAQQFSALLGKYRFRAICLLALSALLMMPLLVWRYGIVGSGWIILPPLLAVLMSPALRALAGSAFTFFDAMALVLILSIGVDYAVFCAETSGDRKPVTMLAVALAACTALMSFGLLALSGVAAVHAFGTTMLLGILLAFLFAPMARRGLR